MLIRGANPIPSACGVRQGDPMGPFLFCLAIQPFLEQASTQVQSLTYMDDIYLVGAPDKMPGVISSLQQNLGSINLNLNTNKSWTTGNVKGLKINSEPKVMKAPVAFGESAAIPLNPKIANTVKAIEKVADTQLALLLLRQVNNNSLTYTLRTSHSLSTKDAVAELTSEVHACLASLLRCDKQDIQRAANRIVMPLGPGLGFTHLNKLALPAFQASASSKLQGSSTPWIKTGSPSHNKTPPPTTGVL